MKRGNMLVQALCEVHARPLDVLGWFARKPYFDALIALLHHGGPPSFPAARSAQLWTTCGSFHSDLTLPGTICAGHLKGRCGQNFIRCWRYSKAASAAAKAAPSERLTAR